MVSPPSEGLGGGKRGDAFDNLDGFRCVGPPAADRADMPVGIMAVLVEVGAGDFAGFHQVLKLRLADIQRSHQGLSANLFSNRGMNYSGHHRSLLKGDDLARQSSKGKPV